jgi:sec-independent protein translocase protein TatB
MSGELLLILVVALLVFGPAKLPMLAKDLRRLFTKYQRLKQQIFTLWEADQQLAENNEKALTADKVYKQTSNEVL